MSDLNHELNSEHEFECPNTNKIYQIKVGKDAQDNWDIIQEADQSDAWFHLDKFPSCHVILYTNSEPIKKIHRSVLRECARLCKNGSKQCNVKNTTVIYTEVKYVKIDKKGDVGSVFTRKTKKIMI
jgi:predicted ribosome quality control (RQC) complex YloA/Tae2 family protein